MSSAFSTIPQWFNTSETILNYDDIPTPVHAKTYWEEPSHMEPARKRKSFSLWCGHNAIYFISLLVITIIFLALLFGVS